MNDRYRITAPALAALAIVAAACGNPQTAAGPTQTTPATTSTISATRTALSTPPPGLTPTGYRAADGSPLYAQCIGKDPASASGATLPLPPVYPTPAGTVAVPSPIAASERGVATPVASAVPALDPLAVAPASASAWPQVSSACMRLTFRYPADLQVLEPFSLHGYQQEATASFGTADRRVVFELHLFYTPTDAIGLVRGSHVAAGEYRFASNQPAMIGGASGYVTYAIERDANYPNEAVVAYIVSPRPNWYLQVIGFVAPPYPEHAFAEFNAMVSSITFAP